MDKQVAIVAAGQTPFTRRNGISISELCVSAFREAVQDCASLTVAIDAVVVCSALEYDRQRSPVGTVIESLRLSGLPTFNVESLCSSGSSGLRTAYGLIRSGLHEGSSGRSTFRNCLSCYPQKWQSAWVTVVM